MHYHLPTTKVSEAMFVMMMRMMVMMMSMIVMPLLHIAWCTTSLPPPRCQRLPSLSLKQLGMIMFVLMMRMVMMMSMIVMLLLHIVHYHLRTKVSEVALTKQLSLLAQQR